MGDSCLYSQLFSTYLLSITSIIYVGDEEKDILCANNAGACSVLINRANETLNYNQKHTIKLLEII